MRLRSLNRHVCAAFVLCAALVGLVGARCADGQGADGQVQHIDHPHADIITLTVPANGLVAVGLADRLQTVERFAQRLSPVKAVINAGFFDPVNTLSTSYVVIDGRVIADPTHNTSLMNNPKLKPYLPAILNRPELRVMTCRPAGTRQSKAPASSMYAIESHLAPLPDNCQITGSIGGGPQLLPVYSPEREGFTAYQDGKRIRDPIGVDRPNARSAVALLPGNQLMLVYVGQQPGKPGLSLPELAAWLTSRGALSAMAFDGGSSTSLWLEGRTYWGKLDATTSAAAFIRRPVKSVLIVR